MSRYQVHVDGPASQTGLISEDPCRLQEQADLNSAKELFGAEAPTIDLDIFVPKSAKDFEELGRAVAGKFLLPHERGANYKTLLKALVKAALGGSDVQQVRDLESCLAGLRSDKVKEEKAAVAAKKGEILGTSMSLCQHSLLCQSPNV